MSFLVGQKDARRTTVGQGLELGRKVCQEPRVGFQAEGTTKKLRKKCERAVQGVCNLPRYVLTSGFREPLERDDGMKGIVRFGSLDRYNLDACGYRPDDIPFVVAYCVGSRGAGAGST